MKHTTSPDTSTLDAISLTTAAIGILMSIGIVLLVLLR